MSDTPLVAVDPPGHSVPSPEFSILDIHPLRHTAAPMLRIDGHVLEGEGREVFTIALSVQVMIEPAKRAYDPETKERLVELFGTPERWAATTNNFLWAELDVLVPAFTGATGFRVIMPCTYDLEVAAAKYLYSLPDGVVPLLFNFTGTIFYRGDGGRIQITKVPWECSARFAMPVSTWREMIDHHYPKGAWIRLDQSTLDTLAARKAEEGLPTFDSVVARMLAEGGP